ncbi:MAG: hypothetical protein ABID71_08285 [Chloroflexota bacterium]
MADERIMEIETQIAELKSRWPAHSVPPRMWRQLEQAQREREIEKEGDK